MGRALKNQSRANPEPWKSILIPAQTQDLHKCSIPSLGGPLFFTNKSLNFLGPSQKNWSRAWIEPGLRLDPSQNSARADLKPDPSLVYEMTHKFLTYFVLFLFIERS